MMEEKDLLKDYKECIERIHKFNEENYRESGEWAIRKYINWMSKNNEYVEATPISTVPPRTEIEKAWNALNNFKTTLENIAMKNGIDINRGEGK